MDSNGRWVCLDVGETLIDETRIWSLWADELGVPRLTFLAALGAVIERGGEHRDVFQIFEADDWQLLQPDVLAMSEAIGVAKPDPHFFAHALELMGSPAPEAVAYVGDRVDNDVLPAMDAGLRAVWIRRGPWGVIQRLPDGARPALVVDSLDELVERVEE